MWELLMCCVWVNAVTITAGGQLDIILVTGDAYVDHPSWCVATMGR